MSEHDEQVALFAWATWQGGQWPELDMMYAIPNGGHRFKAVAAKMKDEGLKPGVPDICLPVARGGFHGLYIEMKFGKNKTTKSQEGWHFKLTEQGYLVMVCYGMQNAKQVVTDYLGYEDG